MRRPVASGVSSPIAAAPGSVPTTSRTDPLTGLLTLNEWNRLVADEDARVSRYRHTATVVIIELDGLERLVATLGREAGDRVLPALADALSRNARAADHLARIGPGAVRGAAPGDRRGRGDQLRRAGPPGLRSVARVGRDRPAPFDGLGQPGPGIEPRRRGRRAPASGCSRSSAATRGSHRDIEVDGASRSTTSRDRPRPPDLVRLGQSRPLRRPRPGVAPVCTPSATTSVPATMTCSMPIG